MMNEVTNSPDPHPYPVEAQAEVAKPRDHPAIETLNRELFRTRASRWTELIPDELVIQEKTISIVRHELLASYVETIPVKDIGRIVYVEGLFFGRIEVLGKNPVHDLYIRGLPKREALIAKNVLDGLLLKEAGGTEPSEWLHLDTRRDVLTRTAGMPPEYHHHEPKR